jgi:ABC-type enterochelin transport system substrate-binding protein
VKVDSAHQVASTPALEPVKVASTTDSQQQPKVAKAATTKAESTKEKITKEETATEKMLANNKQGDRDTNNKNNVNDSEEIVAVYDYETIDNASDFGINTNEDGLYAIKL